MNSTFVIHATYSMCLGPPLLPLALSQFKIPSDTPAIRRAYSYLIINILFLKGQIDILFADLNFFSCSFLQPYKSFLIESLLFTFVLHLFFA